MNVGAPARNSRHLTRDENVSLMSLLDDCRSQRYVAAELAIHQSTVSRIIILVCVPISLLYTSDYLLPAILFAYPEQEYFNRTHRWENRNSIVHLFEWKFRDIADECERFLQYKGYAGVQVSPVSENSVIANRPWWERYQIISYEILSRSGNEEDFLDMSRRCNAVGIRIYVDVVLNHMSARRENLFGIDGNAGNPYIKYYPAVPYTSKDFHQTCLVDNYNDPVNVRNCELVGMNDLNQSSPYVRKTILKFCNKLIDLGAAGFRIDAAKHMWPDDLQYIYSKLNDLNPRFGFAPGSRPYIYQEVIDLDEEAVKSADYTHLGAVTEFRHSAEIGKVFRGNDKLAHLRNWGEGWNFLPSSQALVFVDNHDNQRGHGAGGQTILTYKDAKWYKMATAFMLAQPYGTTRIMSSFYFENTDQGSPPQDTSGKIISPGMNDQGTCTNGWVCEHRWRQIFNMIEFKNIVKRTHVENWWSNGDQQIAFSRGGKGFIAFSHFGDLHETLHTGLSEGIYCDVISGGLENGRCTGKVVLVNKDGLADISIGQEEEDGVLAIHVIAKL